ncbi:lysine transporter LysE [Pleomorphomonas diazotrophica]|uniref:Lysine transporter LysE n=1 Tax=Pleomorphomonas diazotrophica TaxID=1166257 RepID=A0A1I4W519_9HYPH|nr:LysE family translocator [Pleomorphomonas diazotrophica]PKR87856.1 lysine transporter LysE [Pleomorphomonas diazotrophica]SFN08330.1 Threonine/homoserine/homoserine lactone efflux protein [Pleomorphomonas diazotrophica]
MTLDLILALTAYAFVTSITPGPNNTMLLASGVNFGFGPTFPHILGVNLGFSVMVLAVGLGAGGAFVAFPLLHELLRYGGAAYLLYLAWRIARSGGVNGAAGRAEPMTFLQAAAFQWINPKTWIMAIGAITAYTPESGYFVNILVVTLVFTLINGPCVAAWAGFGTLLQRLLARPAWLRAFNVAMALLLVGSLYPILIMAL